MYSNPHYRQQCSGEMDQPRELTQEFRRGGPRGSFLASPAERVAQSGRARLLTGDFFGAVSFRFGDVLKIENILPSKIRPYARNPLANDDVVEKLVDSLGSFGWRQLSWLTRRW